MRTVLKPFVTFALVCSAAGISRADINLCNQSDTPIWVTYGTEEWYSGAMCHVGDSTRDETRGWWHPSPGQCATVEVGCVCNFWADFWGNCPGPVLHYYGETDSGDWWGGNQGWNTCTPWAAFDQCDYADNKCPNGRLLAWGEWFYGGGAVCNITLNFH
jgi:hypothetical protein